jgi:cyclomaltodextrinase
MVYLFARTLPEEIVIVAINAGTESAVETFEISFEFLPKQQLYGQGEVSWQPGQVTVSLPPRSAMILGN